MGTNGQTRLVLWDIDQTLIESDGVGRLVYERAFPAVTGQPLRHLGKFNGRTELDFMHDTLALHGIEPTEKTVRRFAAALADGFRDAIDQLVGRGRVLPGVWEALEALANEPNVAQSVLTGNTADVARIKVEAFGLDRHLDLSLGAYGDDHRDRPELVAIACKRAAQQLGGAINADQVLLVGDTPNDVHAAVSTGAQIIAVASGSYSVDDLRAAGSGTVLQSLADLDHRHWSSG